MTPRTPGDRLENALRDESSDSLRWSAEVPIVTNPFILLDFLRFVLIMALVVFAMAAVPQWFYAHDLSEARLIAILRLCVWGCILFSASLFAVGFFFLRNRFRVLFVLNPWHIYHENARAEKRSGLFPGWRPSPSAGSFGSARAFSREIPWNKTDSFVSFPSARTVLLKRGRREILKLYMPDDATHAKVESYLAKMQLKRRKP